MRKRFRSRLTDIRVRFQVKMDIKQGVRLFSIFPAAMNVPPNLNRWFLIAMTQVFKKAGLQNHIHFRKLFRRFANTLSM